MLATDVILIRIVLLTRADWYQQWNAWVLEIGAATNTAFETVKRSENELSDREEVHRIIRQQEQARDAEQRLDEAYTRGCLL